MPVQPPYSIIDTIARLRASGGAAWGNAAQNVGQSIGSGIQSGIDASDRQKQAAAKANADRYHDATMFADKNFDWVHAPPQAAGAPGGAPSGILQPANAAAAPGGAPPPPAAPARAPGSVTMNDVYLAHGLKPVAGGDALVGTTRQQDKADAADTLEKTKQAGRQKTEEDKEKSAAETAHSKYFTTVDDTMRAMAKHNGTPIGENEKEISKQTADAITKKFVADTNVAGREKTAKTAATAKTDAATITAAGRKQIADINARLKSPDNQIKIQAMKDRDAYITKNPTASKLFGVPDDLGQTGGHVPVGSHPDDAAIDAALSGGK